MTGIINRINSAKTTSEVRQILQENIDHLARSTVLEFIANQAIMRIRNNRIKFTNLIFNN